MKLRTVHLPQLLWYDNDELELQLPSSWQITVCRMRGHARPPLGEEEIRGAFSKPIATKPIRELAKGKKEAAILFDDMARPTRVAEIVPFVLEELEAAGVGDESIRFIAALGAHGALTRLDFAKKLGETVLRRFPVHNHNPYENCTFVGNTSRGTPLAINSEFMSCDFKIGIGCILPHPLTGFAGGGKIILPGVAAIDSIAANHRSLIENALIRGESLETGPGKFEGNIVILDAAEAARMAGLDVKIDAVINARGQTTDLFIGEPSSAHAEGVALAKDIYATEMVEGQDIAILNTYCKASEAFLALPNPIQPPLFSQFLKDGGGDVVIIANAPEGQVTHYLAGSFGKKLGGRLWFPPTTLPQNANRLIILTPYVDMAGASWFGPRESITWARAWPEVLDRLTETYGDKAKVAIVPDATMQYFPE